MLRRILIICCIASALCIAGRHYAFEDGLIYARYVRNALAGHGLVFNSGEHVNGLTSPLFGAFLLLTSLLFHGHILVASTVLSVVFMIASACMAEAIAPWSGLLIVSTAYFYSCFGMETTLFLFLLAFCLWLYLNELYFWLPLFCLLTLLTRAEGIFLILPIAWQLWTRRTRLRPLAFAAPAGIIVVYLWFNYYFYGHLFPASASAKLLHGLSGYWGRWPTAFLHHGSVLLHLFRYSIYLFPAIFILTAISIWKQRGSRMNSIVPPFIAGLFAFYLLLNISNYHWYDAPFIFFGLIYAVLALPQKRAAQWILAAVIVECALTGFMQLRTEGPLRHYQQIAQWMNQHSAPDATVAAVEIGTIGWYCDRKIDDIIGLTNPQNARLLAKHDLTTWLENDKPDYVVVHDPPAFGENAAAASPLYEFEPVLFNGVRVMHRKDSPR